MIYTAIEVVIEKTVRRLRLREYQYDIEDFVEDAADALRHIGAEKVYEEKVQKLVINNYNAPIPLDCQHIMDVTPCTYDWRESGSFIEVLNVPDGTEVTIKYQAMPTDTRGYILVPNDVAVQEAIMWYLIRNMTMQQEIKHIGFQMAEVEWQWRCRSARASLNAWSINQAYKAYINYVQLGPVQGAVLNRTKNLD
jgi:hypothetical protein